MLNANWWFRRAVALVVLSASIEVVTVRFALGDAASPFGFLWSMIEFAMNPLFAITFITAPILGYRAVLKHGLPRMEAWWWWCAPYSVTFSAYHYALQLRRFDVHVLAVFVMGAIVATFATAAWVLVAACQLLLTRQVDRRRLAMIAVALLLVPLMLMPDR